MKYSVTFILLIINFVSMASNSDYPKFPQKIISTDGIELYDLACEPNTQNPDEISCSFNGGAIYNDYDKKTYEYLISNQSVFQSFKKLMQSTCENIKKENRKLDNNDKLDSAIKELCNKEINDNNFKNFIKSSNEIDKNTCKFMISNWENTFKYDSINKNWVHTSYPSHFGCNFVTYSYLEKYKDANDSKLWRYRIEIMYPTSKKPECQNEKPSQQLFLSEFDVNVKRNKTLNCETIKIE